MSAAPHRADRCLSRQRGGGTAAALAAVGALGTVLLAITAMRSARVADQGALELDESFREGAALAAPRYTSASQQDEKWGGAHGNAVQNAYLYAQHVAQSHTGQLLRWRNYVTQRRSDATPQEQRARAKEMHDVAQTEYNQARAQLAAMKRIAVIRRLNSRRHQARDLKSGVQHLANGMLRAEDLAQVKRDEAEGKIVDATKILDRMAHSRLLHGSAVRRLHLPAYGGPPAASCGPSGTVGPDTICHGVPTAVAAEMLGARLHGDELAISAISLNVSRLQHLDHVLFQERAQRTNEMQVKTKPLVVS